ncbi:MAG: SDR family NAD(P)-dependent oxidoreductase [Betaproteobacteria bacterium]
MTESAPLAGRIALVTGSTRGIGRAIAVALAGVGVDVVVHGRTASEDAASAEAEIRRLGRRTTSIAADFVRPETAERLVRGAESALGPIDILVNNAAIARPIPIDAVTLADWNAHVATNLTAAFVATQAVLPGMRERRWGRIIYVSSAAAQIGGVIGPHYAATKAGMLGLTHAYAGLLASEGVTVNAIAPALIDTDMIAGIARARPDVIPVGRLGQVDDVAAVAVLLATNSYITGQTFNVNGGWYMS